MRGWNGADADALQGRPTPEGQKGKGWGEHGHGWKPMTGNQGRYRLRGAAGSNGTAWNQFWTTSIQGDLVGDSGLASDHGAFRASEHAMREPFGNPGLGPGFDSAPSGSARGGSRHASLPLPWTRSGSCATCPSCGGPAKPARDHRAVPLEFQPPGAEQDESRRPMAS